jgi:hypothetical protein
MKLMSAAAVERAMKLQDVMLKAMAKRITWYQAAEILGISCRQMQRWKTRFEHANAEYVARELSCERCWPSKMTQCVSHPSAPYCRTSTLPQ